MNPLHLDAKQLHAVRLVDLPAGTLAMVPTETSSAAGPFWALRFNSEAEDGEVRGHSWLMAFLGMVRSCHSTECR